MIVLRHIQRQEKLTAYYQNLRKLSNVSLLNMKVMQNV